MALRHQFHVFFHLRCLIGVFFGRLSWRQRDRLAASARPFSALVRLAAMQFLECPEHFLHFSFAFAGGAATFKIDWNARDITAGAGNELFWVGGYDATSLYITWTNSEARYVFNRPGGSVTSNPIPSFAHRQWYTVMVVVDNGYATIYHYQPGTNNYVALSTSGFVSNLGSAYRNAAICQTFNGLVDNFGFWNSAKAPSTIINFPNTGTLTAEDQNSLIANFLMDECRGALTVPVTPDTRTQLIQSTLAGALFATKVTDVMRCHGSGDPHYYTWFWDSLAPELHGAEWAPSNYYMTGSYYLTSCRNVFEMRSFQRYVDWWPSAAVIRKTSLKAFNHYFLVSEDEPDQAQGAFHKWAPNDPWVTLPTGAYYDANGVYHNWDGTTLTVIMPQIGYAQIVHAWPQAIDVYLDRTYCSRENRPNFGICDRNITVSRNIDFKDDILGSDPVDPRTPVNTTADPCQGDVALIAAMNKVCLKLHPAGPGNSQYEACKFDVCITGDPDTPIVGGGDPSCVTQDWLNSHPRTLNANQSLPISQATTCDPCPNFCSFHGTCNSGSGACTCESGWTGRDCGLPAGFDCYGLESSSAPGISRNVQPLVALTGNVDLQQFLAPYTVEDSILMYPLSQRISAAWDSGAAMSFVITAGSTNSKGSAVVSLDFGTSVATFEPLISRPSGVASANADAQVGKNGNTMSITLSWNYAPVTVRINKLPAFYTLSARLTTNNGVAQILVGSGVEGRTQMDVIRVPVADTFTLRAQQCTSSPCDNITSCSDCAAAAQCGYCVESGRCMRGDSFGPLRGTCSNWRFSFDPTVSRRVTSQFGFPVNPVKAEVYLTSAVGSDNPNAELPVDLSVSTVDLGNVWDVLVMVNPRTSLASASAVTAFNTKVRSALETSLVPSLLDDRLYPDVGLAIATYGDSVRIVRDFTEVKQDTLYLFGAPIQTISNMVAEAADRQVSALAGIVPAGGASPKWRKNARRLVIITADANAVASQAAVNTMRASLIEHRIFPVVLINRDACGAACRANWNSLLTNPTTGIGFGFSLTFDSDYNEFAGTVRKAIRLATGQISLTYDRSKSGHINTNKVATLGDSLQVFGLTRNFRGRFAVPFKRFSSIDSTMLTATITAVGFGSATVEDIVTEVPTADDIRQDSLQDQVVYYFLQGKTYKNLLRTTPIITSLPTGSSLFDTNTDGTMGVKITAGMLPYAVLHPSGKVWFLPDQFKHSPRDGNGGFLPMTSYTYTVHDGCAPSAVSRVTHYVQPVNDPPNVVGTNPSQIITPEDQGLPFQVVLDDPDYDPKDNLRVSFTRLPEKADIIFEGAPVVIGNLYPYTERTYPFTYQPNGDWWGADSFRVVVRDNGTPPLERPATIQVSVTPVNDAPIAVSAVTYVETPERVVAMVPLSGDDKDRVYGDLANATIYMQLSIDGSFKGTLCRVNFTGVNCSIGDTLADGDLVPISLSDAPVAAKVYYRSLEGATEYSCATNEFIGVNCTVPYTRFSWKVVDSRGSSSAVVEVPIYVTQVENPPLVPLDQIFNTKENISVSITLTGQNVEFPAEALSFRIESFPEHVTLKRQDGSVINFASPLVGSYPTITATPDLHLHGQPMTGWLFGSLTYTGADRLSKSNIGSINITVEAVNDPPVPTFHNVTLLEKTATFFDLTAFDIDNPQSDLVFTVTALNDREKGQLFLVNPAAANFRGAEITALPVPVPKVTYNGTNSNWLLYVPSGYNGYFYGTDAFTYTVSDVDTFGNSVVNAVDQVALVTVEPVNDAPIVNVQPFQVSEDDLAIITLAGQDPWYGENDPLQAIIQRFYTPATSAGCRNKMGKLYQYTGNINNPKGVEIDLGNLPARVTDASFRVVYEPFPNANNDPNVPYLYVEPVIDYLVVETDSHASPSYLQSAFQSVPIVITPRNDLPVTLGVQINQIEACTDSCTYKKNFGRSFRETLGFAGIFFGGDDVEKGTLTPVITAVRGETNNFVLQTLDTHRRILPSDIDPARPETWIPINREVDLVPPTGCNTTASPPPFVMGLEFQPGLDEYSRGSFYVQIDYRVRDEQDALSTNTKTITINIENTPLPPRADQFNQYVLAFQNTARDFVIRAFDPDQDAFQMIISSCSGDATSTGRFQLLKADGTVDTSVPAINCPTTQRSVFPSTPRDATGYQNWRVRYTPPTNKVGQNINMLTLSYDDGRSVAGLLDTYYVITDVQKENRAPVIRINGVPVVGAAEPITQTGVLVAPLSVAFSDPDIPASFQSTPISVSLSLPSGGQFILNNQAVVGNITLDSPLSGMNAFLASLRVNASEGYRTYTVSMVANDQGNFGFCRVEGGEPAPCALETKATVNIEFYESPSSVNSVAIGSASAAAAAAAIIAAALIFRKINRAPEDAYKPWALDADNDQGVVLNPLFEADTIENENPLFEAPTQPQAQ